MISIHDQISSNRNRSIFLIIIFICFLLFFGYIIGFLIGSALIGIILMAIIACIIIPLQYYEGDKLILKMTKVRPATKKEFPHLVNTVEGLAIAAGVPAPKIYVTEDTAPNAFATGRNPEHSSIVVTTGLIQKLNRMELEGVIAHEMSHIQNRDIKIMMLTTVIVGIVMLRSYAMVRSFIYGGHGRGGGRDKGGGILIAVAFLFLILSPIIAKLMQLAISRKREFLADANGAMLTRYPPGLASALAKLEHDKEPLEVANKATAHLYIVNPMKNFKGWLANLGSTHPPIQKRIAALNAMSM